MQKLGGSWDVVEVLRSLVTEVDALQKIVAGLEARLPAEEYLRKARVAPEAGPQTMDAAAESARGKAGVASVVGSHTMDAGSRSK